MRNTDMGRASLRKDTIDQEKYIWEIYFDNMYGSVDAQTGELLSYGYYGDDAGGKLNLTKDAARKIAENFLQKVVPQKFSESKYIPDYNEDIIIFREEEKPEAYTFRYNRVVDGVVFIDNGLNVAVNRTTGNITSYSCNWFDSATFRL